MKKRLLVALLLVLALCATCFAFVGCGKDKGNDNSSSNSSNSTDNSDGATSDEVGSDGLEYKLGSDSTYYIVKEIGACVDTYIIIPSTYNGKPVKGIGNYAFAHCSKLTSIEIPNSVTSIGYGAFEYCSSLTSVTIPNSVTSIGDSAFAYCRSLTSIEIPNSVTSIGYWAFEYCSSLTSIEIPNSVTSIGYRAFEYCSSLTEVTIPNSVTSIGDSAFEYCSSLTEVTIPNSVTSIGDRAFEYCRSLTSIEIPNSVTSIGEGAFYDCDSLTSVIIGDSVTSIGDEAFRYCSSLTSVTFEENSQLTSIGSYAFSGCSKLTSIEISNSVTSIGYRAFEYCSSLTSITLPFVGASLNGTSNTHFGYIFGASSYSDNSTYVPTTLKTVVITGGESIGYEAFCNCSSLTSVTIGDSVTSIGDYAFYNCSSLTSITVDENNKYYKSIDGNLYNKDGTTLIQYAIGKTDTSFTIPNGVTSIGAYAFQNCSRLTSVIIGDSVTSISYGAFYGCSRLTYNEYDNAYYLGNEENKYLVLIKAKNTSITSCTINPNTKVIAGSAFYGCSSLTKVNYTGTIDQWVQISFSAASSNPTYYANNLYINDELVTEANITTATKINAYAFYKCRSLTEVTIPNSVTSIGSGAFRNCSKLTSIEIPNSVTSIGNYAFCDCSSLTSIEIPNSITSIGSYAFYNCSSLTSVTIGDSVTSIGDYAFYNCSSLTKVNYTGTIDQWVQISFSAASSNPTYYANNLYINDELVTEANITTATKINAYAFYKCRSLTSVTIGNSVTSIGGRAFEDCSAEIIWGDNPTITTIGSYAFSGYEGTSIEIPNSVTSIGDSAFSGCIKLVEVYNLSSLSITAGSSNNGDVGYYAKVVHMDINEESILTTDANGFVTFDNNGVKTLIAYKGDDIEIVIPDDIQAIYQYAFFNCTSLTSVTIGNSVISIGSYAFEDCDSLTYNEYDNAYYLGNEENKYLVLIKAKNTSITSCTINPNTKVIAGSAFYGCSSLTKVNYTGTIDQWVQISFSAASSNPTYYANNLYINDELVTEANITTATKINAYAFYKCRSLTSVTIGNSVTSIGSGAFRNCSKLTSIEIPNSVTSIGNYAFCDCSSLTSIEIPNSITSIGSYAFSGYEGTSIEIPNSVTSIGDSAFSFCRSLTSVTIGDSVTSIGYRAFAHCSKLTSIEIPNSVISIGNYAFAHCSKLTSIEIPNSVTSIGYGAFYDCSSLTSITLPFVGASLNGTSNTHFGYIFGASSYNSTYIPTSLTVAITGVTSIDSYAFFNCTSLTSVTIGNSVISIGSYAFSGCSRLTYNEYDNAYYLGNEENKYLALIEAKNTSITSCTINPNTKVIAGSAFSGCSKLTSIEIPNSVTSIGERAFSGCSKLTSIEIPNSVTSIGYGAFEYCSRLTSITVDEDNQYYKSIDGNLYNGNGTTLIQYAIGKTDTSFTIPNSVTSIGSGAFEYCSSLTSIEIPNSVTSIGSGAFEYCSSLTSIEIPNSVTSIGGYAFYNCSSLTKVTIGDSVTSIGYWAFYDCSSLTSITVDENNKYYKSIDGNLYNKDGTTLIQYAIGKTDTSFTIPNSVTSIGYSAFSYCSSLTSIEIPNSVTSIGSYAFYNCRNLTSVTIGDSVTSIGSGAFYNCSSLNIVYYKGSADDWANISIGSYNTYLKNATRYYYIENEVDVPTDGGNYWHYDDGVPTIWATNEE